MTGIAVVGALVMETFGAEAEGAGALGAGAGGAGALGTEAGVCPDELGAYVLTGTAHHSGCEERWTPPLSRRLRSSPPDGRLDRP